MKKFNNYFFGSEKITGADAFYFYGLIGGSLLLSLITFLQ